MKTILSLKNRAPVYMMVCILMSICICNYAPAQELIKDINQSENPFFNEYGEAIDVNGMLYYISRNELWKTQGTIATTARVKTFQSLRSLVRMGSMLYFNANNGSGEELWKSDGTQNGTVQVKDIYPGTAGSAPEQLTVCGSLIYFVANDGTHGKELWKSDGTTHGTMLVKDIIRIKGSSNPSQLTASGDKLYFVANNSVNGYEPWITNGTEPGTMLLKDIKPGTTSSSAKAFTNVNNTVYFTAETVETGRELWKTNGTPEGTVLLKDIYSGTQGSSATNLVAVGSTLFFSADNGINGHELWKSAGTTSSTVMVKDLTPGARGSYSRSVWYDVMSDFTNINGKLYFTAYNERGYYFWKSDGTAAGTVPFLPASKEGISGPSLLVKFTALNNNVYFYNTNRDAGTYTFMDLMREDASGNISRISSLILADYYSSENQMLVKSGSRLYLTGRATPADGFALFQTDGISTAQKLIDNYSLKDQSSSPNTFARLGNILLFVATTDPEDNVANQRQNLWKTDGTAAGTTMLMNFSQIYNPVHGGNVLYFLGVKEDGQTNIYKSDGTAAGTKSLALVPPSAEHPYLRLVGYGNGKLFFLWQNFNDQLLYTYDGTTTQQVGRFAWTGFDFAVIGANVYFNAIGFNSDKGTELWRSNGTAAGTVMVKDLNPGVDGSYPQGFAILNGILYFSAFRETIGYELWRSNGTGVGTYVVRNISTSNHSRPNGLAHLTAFNNELFFTYTELGVSSLWKTDGTRDGTIRLTGIAAPMKMTAAGDQLYLFTSENGYNLWSVRDDAEVVHHLTSLPDFGYPYYFLQTVVDGILYVPNAVSMWRSDGTSCGTFAVPLDVTPTDLASLGNNLIFGGFNSAIGTELYKLNTLDIVPPECEQLASARQAESAPDNDVSISYHPNPFTSDISLNVSGPEAGSYKVIVHDMRNMMVQTEVLSYNRTYTLGTQWQPGLYVVRIEEAEKVSLRRVLKSK